MPELIKVHVTKEQREELEFLVNRRIGDVYAFMWDRVCTVNARESLVKELELLAKLKEELNQAGT